MKHKTNTLPGFSLVELLVVIAIVGLLVSMVLPALSQSREVAKTALCMARMRDFSLRIENYREDYKKWYTVNYADNWGTIPGTDTKFSPNFVDMTLPYMNGFGNTNWKNRSKSNHYLCPSDYYQPVAQPNQKDGDAAGIRKTAYITSWRITNYMMSGVFGYGNMDTMNIQFRPRREIRTVSPSVAVMMGEIAGTSPMFGYLYQNGSNNIFPHLGKTNVLFAAGNVRSYPRIDQTNKGFYLNNGLANSMEIWFQ